MLRTMAVLMAATALCGAAPPEQFRVWGTAGPEFPPVPEGWSLAPDAEQPAVALRATEEEARRGFVLFARDPFAPVPPNAVPLPLERTAELRLFAARGEYEPASFCLHALRPLADVRVQAGELRSSKGHAIPADHLDLRFVRSVRVPLDPKAKTYRLQPFLLEKRKSVAVGRGATAQVWLTVKVPEDAAAGTYSGSVSVATAAGEAASLKVSVEVLPFTLPPAPIEMAMFYPRQAADDTMLLKELTDMREHGLNGFEPAVSVQIKSRDQVFGDDDVAATRVHCRRMMAATRKVFGPWQFPVTFAVGHQIAYYWDPKVNWFVHWPHSKKIDDDLCKAIEVVRDLSKTEGWPPLRAYVMDEAGAHNLLDEAVYYYGLVKRRYPDITTWTDIGGGIALGHDEIGQLDRVVDNFSTNRFTPQIAKALLARKKPYGVYNGAGHTLAGPRFFFGFYGFKTGAAQIAQWVYHFGDSVFKGNGFRQEDEGYVYPGPDGPLPSIHWESVREGVDDYRYVTLLRQLMLSRREAAKPGGDVLRNILSQINWEFQALASGERSAPPHPATLRKWRRRIAEAILALQPGERLAAPPTVSPFDFPWAEPEKEETKYGEELLPPSGFDGEHKPWRVEAWNGKGQGLLDVTEGHTKRGAMRIENPVASGSQAVTVLVWPSWGPDPVKLPLEGGRAYEFAAWAKCQGRGTPPSMRLVLPEGSEASSRSGADAPDANGWQRTWTRSEVAFRTTPKYLGVWVQGPGVVWIDDLSLREVIPPPLTISLDQPSYDGLDKVGFATIAVAKTVSPTSVRFTLGPSQVTAPFQAQAELAPQDTVAQPPSAVAGLMLLAPASLRRCQVAFDPSKLEPGTHEAKAELLDAAGKPFAAKSVALKRLSD